MTNYSLSRTDVAVHRKTLAPNVEDVVTFDGDLERIVVVNFDASADLFVTLDGSAATVAGAQCYVVPAGAVLNETSRYENAKNPQAVVHLISASAVVYTVQKASNA